jgi:pyridoxamine 5'-phosphate oxidase
MIHLHELKDLSLLERAIWSILEHASFDKKHPMHLCAITTVDPEGYPESRMVVLRAASYATKTLSIHTDIRSGKIESLHHSPYVSLLFWDKTSSVQLRVRCRAILHHKDPLALEKLLRLSPAESSLYAYEISPGDILEKFEEALDFKFRNELIQEHFCWIECTTSYLDFLHLARDKAHTRATFSYEEAQLIGSNYVKA